MTSVIDGMSKSFHENDHKNKEDGKDMNAPSISGGD